MHLQRQAAENGVAVVAAGIGSVLAVAAGKSELPANHFAVRLGRKFGHVLLPFVVYALHFLQKQDISVEMLQGIDHLRQL